MCCLSSARKEMQGVPRRKTWNEVAVARGKRWLRPETNKIIISFLLFKY